MVVRRRSGRLVVFRKPSYPAGIFRLLTGVVEANKSILAALQHEVHEETGLTTGVVRFLVAEIGRGSNRPQFVSFASLLEEKAGILGVLDPL